jgi:hypothetical protein
VEHSRRWGLTRVAALLLAVALLSPISPLLLVSLPLAVLLLAFRPGRLLPVLVAGLLVWLIFQPAGEQSGLWYAERAWALITAGAFILITLRWPRLRLALRSIGAVASGIAVLALFGLVRPGALGRIDWWVASELRWTSRVVASWLAGSRSDSLIGSVSAAVAEMVELQIVLYPSLLALATIAALCVAWYVTARLAGTEGAVGPLRDFGFSDHFIWILIGGLLLFLLPIGELASRIGQNALAFMGGLYIVRGAAVLAWMIPAVAVSSWAGVLWALLALLFYPIALGLALVLGVSDTWLHLRSRFGGSEGTRGST